MLILDKDTARSLPVMMIDSADHVSPKTGIAEGDVTVNISKNLGSLTSFTITGKWTEIGQGLYSIDFSASDLDTEGFFAYLVTASGCDQYSGMMYVAPATSVKVWDEAAGDHTSSGSTGEAVNRLDVNVSSRSSHTDPERGRRRAY